MSRRTVDWLVRLFTGLIVIAVFCLCVVSLALMGGF